MALDAGHDDGQGHLLRAPGAEVRDGVSGKDLGLGAESLERMAGDVKAEDLLLFRQSFRFGPRLDVGQRMGRLHFFATARGRAEQRGLTSGDVFLLERRLADGEIEGRGELGAMSAQRIHGPGVDESFEDALIANTEIDALAEIEE